MSGIGSEGERRDGKTRWWSDLWLVLQHPALGRGGKVEGRASSKVKSTAAEDGVYKARRIWKKERGRSRLSRLELDLREEMRETVSPARDRRTAACGWQRTTARRNAIETDEVKRDNRQYGCKNGRKTGKERRTPLDPLLVHNPAPALPAPDRLTRLDLVARCAVCARKAKESNQQPQEGGRKGKTRTCA